MNSIDLNCDLAEGGKFDKELMPLISSCNIACGGHYGNKESMKQAVSLALLNQVNIGAHPSYPDKEHFGRRSLNISSGSLRKSLKSQILLLKTIIERVVGKLHHVKPHGALYNDLVADEIKAKLMIELVEEIDPKLILFVPPKSVIKDLAKNRLETWKEGFADRNYEADFSLVSRQKKRAVLHEKKAVFQHVLGMVLNGEIRLKNQKVLTAEFDTICVHSDTKNSVEILRYLRENLLASNIKIK